MSNPYNFNLEGLSVVVYANNRTDANEIFNGKLLQHDAKIREEAIDEFVEYVKQYMWWSDESYEKVIGEFALGEYAIAFKNKLKEKKE